MLRISFLAVVINNGCIDFLLAKDLQALQEAVYLILIVKCEGKWPNKSLRFTSENYGFSSRNMRWTDCRWR